MKQIHKLLYITLALFLITNPCKSQDELRSNGQTFNYGIFTMRGQLNWTDTSYYLQKSVPDTQMCLLLVSDTAHRTITRSRLLSTGGYG